MKECFAKLPKRIWKIAVRADSAFFNGALFDFLEESYVRLFVNAQNGITAPLYHSCYQDTGQPDSQSGLMGESAGFMRQFFKSKGLSLANSINEPPDHLSIELEYLYFLLQQGVQHQHFYSF